MRFAFAMVWLPATVVAMRIGEGGTLIDADDVRMSNSVASESNVEVDSGAELKAGVVLRGRYLLKERVSHGQIPGEDFPRISRRKFSGEPTHLGTGGLGDTWKAYDSELKHFVAVKLFYDDSTQRYLTWKKATEMQKKLLKINAQECSMVQKMMLYEDKYVGSQRICKCYEEHVMDALGTNEPVFLVLELCGTELYDFLSDMQEKGTTDVARARSWIKQALEGIAFIGMLDPPLIHHDLKPENLVADGIDLKIIDFGATIQASRSKPAINVYTPTFAAPEVLESSGGKAFEQPAHSFDVYSLGLVYIQCLCPQVSELDWYNESTDKHKVLDQSVIRSMLQKCEGLLDDPSTAQDVELIARMVRKAPTKRAAPLELLDSPPLKNARWSAPATSAMFSKGDEVDINGVQRGVIADVRSVDGRYVYDVRNLDGSDLLVQGADADVLVKPMSAKFENDWLVMEPPPEGGPGAGAAGEAARL